MLFFIFGSNALKKGFHVIFTEYIFKIQVIKICNYAVCIHETSRIVSVLYDLLIIGWLLVTWENSAIDIVVPTFM